mgnify:CR=1 FL=1
MSSEECLSKYLRRITIYSFDDIRSRVLSKYLERVDIKSPKRDPVNRAREIYVKKMSRCLEEVINSVSQCDNIPDTGSMHNFYSELIRNIYGDKYDQVLRECRSVRPIAKKIYREYKNKIVSANDVEEIKRISREFIGRLLSLAKRKLRDIETLRRVVIELSKTPCLEENTKKIVLTGMPQVGKSTFLSVISRAKPEISNYPFTTKNIIAGHFIDEKRNIRVMFLDTPGILDRPISEMNPIELRAVYAIKHLPDAAIFIIDPRRNFYYTLDQQLKTFDTVRELLGDKKMYVAINKIDAASEEEINEAIKRFSEEKKIDPRDIFLISALKRIGVDQLLERVLRDL